MSNLTLYLIRHARADERGSKYPDDTKRPLIEKGFTQAQNLAEVFQKLEIRFDYVFSSPYTRAVQTAQPLKSCLKQGNLEFLESLTSSDYDQLLGEINGYLKKSNQAIALVGHEPYLSALASYLLIQNSEMARVKFKKAAWMVLSGKLESKSMALEMFVPYKFYKYV
jgi:phosphohistidine phosphatase